MKHISINTFIAALLFTFSLAGCSSKTGKGIKHVDSRKTVDNRLKESDEKIIGKLLKKSYKIVDKMSEEEVKDTLGKSEFDQLEKSGRLEKSRSKLKASLESRVDARKQLANSSDGINRLKSFKERAKEAMEKEQNDNIKSLQGISLQILEIIIKDKEK